MSPAAQQAFEAWALTQWAQNENTLRYGLYAFEAGYNAAARLLLPVIEDAAIAQSDRAPTFVGDAGSNPAGSTITAETVYAAYPRKVARSAAIKAIQKAGKEVGMEKLLKAVKAYATATGAWSEEDKQYIPHPATFFNQGRYDDDPKEWERGVVASQFLTTH